MGPITHLYAQVWWKSLPVEPLPAELIQRFDGKAMAIMGYEVDQVRKTPQGDVSVPINMAYNHHHDAFFTGKHSKMKKIPYDPHDTTISPMARSDPNFITIPVETSPSPLGIPTSAHLAAGNGGEYRKSYHGFAFPTAYVVDSPQSVHVLPMQIDTWNRAKMNITGSPFVPGPLPKHSLSPNDTSALYSGVLECPITDRIQKIIPGGTGFNSTFAPALFECSSNVTRCAHVVGSATDCFAAAQKAVGKVATVETSQVASDSMPSGCTLSYDGANRAKAFFNTKQTKQCCGSGVAALAGKVGSLVDLEMTVSKDTVQFTITGPDNVWYAAGFFAQNMNDAPYTIVVDGAGNVTERRMANHAAGTLLATSIKVISNTVASGKRTVVLSRPAVGASKQHASFTLQDLSIPFITAIGTGSALAYHASKTASSITLWPNAGQSVCMCEQPAAPFGSAKGNIKYLPTGEEYGFVNYCEPEPRESVLASHNPTCDVRAYVGGLQVCKHMFSLLDSDQEQPWPDQPLVYYQVVYL
jgi:hypothetical protein